MKKYIVVSSILCLLLLGYSIVFAVEAGDRKLAATRCVTNKDCNDGNSCTDDVCLGGRCAHTANSASCNDGNACTTGDHCAGGRCVGTPVICKALDQCHAAGTCKPATGQCTNPVKANGASCDDGNVCTTRDHCSNGACVGGPPLNCNDGNPCTTDKCISTAGCVHTNNTGSCNDFNSCTGNDICSDGICSGTCNATNAYAACCDDPQCEGEPICAFPGGDFYFKITGITQNPASCLVNQNTLNAILGLLNLVGLNRFPVAIPEYSTSSVAVDIPLPFISTFSLIADFSGRSLMITPGEPVTANLGGAGIAPYMCIIEGEPSGGLFWGSATYPNLSAQINVSGMSIQPSDQDKPELCGLNTPGPACTLIFTLQQTR